MPRKKFWGSKRIRTHDLCDIGGMLYQLSYEALLETCQWVISILYPLYMKGLKWCEYDLNHKYSLQIQNTYESDPHSYEATTM